MTEITVKKYLQRIKKLDAIIERKKNEIADLDAQRQSITAQMGGERVQTSPQPDRMANLTAKIVDIQNEIVSDTARLIDERRQIIKIIEQAETGDQYNVLYLVYVKFMLLKEAAAELGIGYDNVKGIHGDALEYIRKNVPAPDGYKFIPKPKKQ